MLSSDLRNLAEQLRQQGGDALAHPGPFCGLLLNLDAMAEQAEQLERTGRPVATPAAPQPAGMCVPGWFLEIPAVRA